MPKELFEITMFNAGTICNPSQTDIPSEAASNSLNLDPIAEDGKLKGIPENTKIEDSCGHENNILLQNITDSTKHDLISYKNANNNIYKVEDLYSGSGTEASLGALTSATDDKIAMEVMEGAVYLGQGTSSGAHPQWIGRLDHGQWQEDAPNTLVMQDDTLDPPNIINETTTACSDGTYIYTCNGGGHGVYSEDASADGEENLYSVAHGVGEITKIRISDGKVMARSTTVLGYINGICMSWDQNALWVISSEKWSAGSHVASVTTENTHTITKLEGNDLSFIKTYTTNLNALITGNRTGENNTTGFNWEDTTASDGADDGNDWEDEDSYWEGQGTSHEYEGPFSDILELNGRLWVCTSAAAIFSCQDLDPDINEDDGTYPMVFVDRTPMGLGYYKNTEALTEHLMPPGGMDNQTGGWYNDSTGAWNFPSCHNASLLQVTGSNDYVGMYFRNGQSNAMNLDIGLSTKDVERKGLILVLSENVEVGKFINGSDAKIGILDDTHTTTFGVREINNVSYKCPKDVYKVAYNHQKTWSDTVMLSAIREFNAPAYNFTHGVTIVTTEVEATDTNQIPLRVSDTEIIGLISDTNLSMGQSHDSTLSTRNQWRKMSKWVGTGLMTSASDWTRTSVGSELFLSQRAPGHQIKQTETDSSFHIANAGYFYRFSFVYDGFQESPLGAAMMVWSNAKTVKIPFTFNTDNFPTRVTAIRIYRATSISASDRNIGGFYHYLGEIDITTQTAVNMSVNSTYSDGYTTAVNEGDEMDVSLTRTFDFTDNGAAGATYETMSGLFEAMTDSNVQYSLSTQVNSTLFIANCEHHSQDNSSNIMYKSLPFKPSLINWALDFLKLPAIPTAIKSFNGRIYAFTESTTHRIEPNSFYIEDSFEGSGCIGPDAVFVSDYGMVYCDNTNIYFTQGGIPIPIGDSILTSDAGIGYLDLLNVGTFSPKVGFDAKRKSFVVFITATKAWSWNVIRKVWNLWEYDASNKVKGITTGKEGEILAALNDNHIYDMFSNATRKAWSWTSKRLSMAHKTQKKRFYEQITSYEGTAPTVNIYFDYSGSADGTVTAGTSEDNIVRKDLKKLNHRLIQTKVTGAANTEVDNLGFTFRRFVKLIDQAT